MQFRIQLTKSFGEEDGKVSAKRHRSSSKKHCAALRRNDLHIGFDPEERPTVQRMQHAKWRGGVVSDPLSPSRDR